MFQGAYAYHIDDKGRLKMPAEFVHGLGPSFTLTRGQQGELWILPDDRWNALVARLESGSMVDQRLMALQRYFIGSAARLSLDQSGRLSVPPVLREMAGLQHEVMIVGTGARVELWARDRWDEYQKHYSPEFIEELARSAGI